MVKMNFSIRAPSAPEEKIFCNKKKKKKKYTCRNSKHIYLGVPDFTKPVREGKGKREKGTEQTPGIIFLIPLFSPSLSQEGFCGSELLILSAFDLYGLSLLSNYMRDLSFFWARSFNSISAFHRAQNSTVFGNWQHTQSLIYASD